MKTGMSIETRQSEPKTGALSGNRFILPMKKTVNLVFKCLGWLAAFVLVVDLFWCFAVPALLGKFLSPEVMEHELKNKSDINSVILGLEYNTRPDFSISIRAAKIELRKNADTIFDATGIYTRLKVLPLLLNKVYVNDFVADNLKLNVVRSKNGDINILKLLPTLVDEQSMPEIKALKVNLNKYKVSFFDETLKQKVRLSGDYFKLKEFVSDKKISVEAIGQIEAGETDRQLSPAGNFSVDINANLPIHKNLKKSDFIYNVWAGDIDLSAFSAYTKYIKSSEIKGLDGKITASIHTKKNPDGTKKITADIVTKNLLLKENLPENSTYLKEKANIRLEADIVKDVFKINKLHLKTEPHDILLSGKILDIDSKNPQLDLVLKLHNDKNSMIYYAVPSEIDFEDRMIAKIKKYMPKATVDGEVTIKGDFLEPEINGEFSAPDLFIDLPAARQAKAKIKLVFVGKKLRVLASVVPNKGATVDVDGICELYGEKSAIFDIKSSKNVELPVTKAVLIPIQDTFGLDFGILNQMNVYAGHGDAVLHITGTRENPYADGYLNFYGGKASLDGLNAVVSDVSGFLNFNKKDVDFAVKTAFIGPDKINVSGKADLEGNFDIDAASKAISLNTLVNLLKSSEILSSVPEKFSEINLVNAVSGKSELNINLKGKFKYPQLLNSIDDINYSGNLKMKNNTAKISGLNYPVKISNGSAEFDNQNVSAKLNTQILHSFVNVDAAVKGERTKVYATADKFRLNDLILIADKNNVHKRFFADNLPESRTSIRFSALYDSPGRLFNPNNLKLNANIFYDGDSRKNGARIYANRGSLTLKNGSAYVDKLYMYIVDSAISLDGNIKNVFAAKPDYNLNFKLQNFDVANLNYLSQFKLLPGDIKKVLSAYGDYSGAANGTLQLKKSGIDGKLALRDVKFVHKKMQMPISLMSTDLVFKNDTMSVKSLNAMVDDVPLFVNLDVRNFSKKPLLSGYVTSNLYPTFINKYINANLGYPIKLKGELRLKTFLSGRLDALKSTSVLSFPIGADVSYMGANLGEDEFERELKIDTVLGDNSAKFNEVTYSKYIQSQNGTKTKYPYITMSGKVTQNGKQFLLNNIHVKTKEKTSTKFFNILFKKSILKYGDFECDLTINGTSEQPRILGFLKARNLDIPMYETIIKDVFADFKPNVLAIKVLGSIYDTDTTLIASLDNRLTTPYRVRNLDIKADYLDLDKVFDNISKVTMPSPAGFKNMGGNELVDYIKPSDIIIDKGTVTAREILIKGFAATELEAKIKHGADNILKIDNFDFKIAKGTVSANGLYDFNSSKFKGDCIAKSIDANIFSQIFLNVKNQIFGNLDGTVNFVTQGTTQTARIKNLDCKVAFIIKDGKMPKLGSLEYLLRAGNVVKSGITGFTINNIIDLLIPVKTGDFSAINGNLLVEKGNASKINIYSKGKNLSLYVTGSADLMNSVAKMVVYGRLSKKVATLLGPIGNTSLNTLFSLIPGIKLSESENSVLRDINKIPGLDLSSDDYRFFSATIDGDLNGEDFVKAFKWLE